MFPMLFPFRHTHFFRLSTGQAYSFICVYFCASAAIGHGCNTFRHVVGCLVRGEICGFVIMSKKKEFIFLKFVEQILVGSPFCISNLIIYMLREDFHERDTVLVLCSVCRWDLVGRVQNLLHSAEVNVLIFKGGFTDHAPSSLWSGFQSLVLILVVPSALPSVWGSVVELEYAMIP